MGEKRKIEQSEKNAPDDLLDAADNEIESADNNLPLEFELESPVDKAFSSDSLIIDEDEEDILSLLGRQTKVGDRGATIAESPVIEDDRIHSDPIFRKLANPELPHVPVENRARLQMQSPNRLYLYWSFKNNPYQTLSKAFGGRRGTYILVVKLKNLTNRSEEIFPVESDGNWWFNADSGSKYRAEIGFYAPNRPFIRIMFSNEIRTPRKTPSKRTDYTPSFNVSANQFAEVLDSAGYRRDAFNVAIAGDDQGLADTATRRTYARLTGNDIPRLNTADGDEIRFALLALASGYSLEEIRDEISKAVYLKLAGELKELDTAKILDALKEYFDIYTDEKIEEEFTSAVFGGSLVNFPVSKRRKNIPKVLLPKLAEFLNPESITSPIRK